MDDAAADTKTKDGDEKHSADSDSVLTLDDDDKVEDIAQPPTVKALRDAKARANDPRHPFVTDDIRDCDVLQCLQGLSTGDFWDAFDDNLLEPVFKEAEPGYTEKFPPLPYVLTSVSSHWLIPYRLLPMLTWNGDPHDESGVFLADGIYEDVAISDHR